MADQELRDRYGSLIGKIKTLSDGRFELRDKYGSLKGTYNPQNNETRDSHGGLVGKGNILTTLL